MYGVWCGVGGLWDVTGRKEKRLRGGGGGGGWREVEKVCPHFHTPAADTTRSR